MTFDKTHLNQLYRYCFALTAHKDNAYDLLQTSLEKYLKHQQHQNQWNSSPQTAYLRRIIRNQFIDDARHAKCVPFEELTDANEATTIDIQPLDNLFINEESVDQIWELLNTSEREVIFLWAIEGYTVKEISEEINVPRGTILSKIHRLRQKVQKTLAKKEQQQKTLHGKRAS